MNKTVTKALSLEEQKADEYRYWQSVPASERIRCGVELSKEAYKRRGLYKDGQELDRILVTVRPVRGGT